MQVIANLLMRKLWHRTILPSPELHLAPFAGILKAGLVKSHEGLFLRNVIPRKWNGKVPDAYKDLSGFEYSLNSVHVDDFLGPQKPVRRRVLVRAGVSLALELGFRAALQGEKVPLNFIISLDEEAATCNVTFHVIRKGEEVVPADPSRYAQAVMYLVFD